LYGSLAGVLISPSFGWRTQWSTSASAWILVKASPVASEGTSNQLVFNRYGETYFLEQVNTAHDRQVHECFKCRGERELAEKYRASAVQTAILNLK
jgi:hypothetical protein